jgi:hypothetical protein
MELECVRCSKPTGTHCSTDSCLWSVCVPCGIIYAPTGCIPTWDRYQREQNLQRRIR